MRFECVFVKNNLKPRNSLANAATSLDVVFSYLLDLSLMRVKEFFDNKHLFVSHFLMMVGTMEYCSNTILYLCLGLSKMGLSLEEHGRWNSTW